MLTKTFHSPVLKLTEEMESYGGNEDDCYVEVDESMSELSDSDIEVVSGEKIASNSQRRRRNNAETTNTTATAGNLAYDRFYL